MSKISYVSGNLHRISDHLSEATTRKALSPEEEASENFPAQTVPAAPAAPPEEEPRKDYAELHKHLKPRFEELLRLKRDVIARITEHISFYTAESDALGNRKAELDATAGKLNALLKSLEECEIPDFADQEFKPKLTNALRAFENARLEDIRTGAKMEGSAGTAGRNASPPSSAEPSFLMLTGGELFKKGFAFFLPLILALLFSAILLSAAFFAAWKIAF